MSKIDPNANVEPLNPSKTGQSKVSESQKRANRKWARNNRERNNFIKKRSAATCFIRDNASLEDLQKFKKLIFKREMLLTGKVDVDVD